MMKFLMLLRVAHAPNGSVPARQHPEQPSGGDLATCCQHQHTQACAVLLSTSSGAVSKHPHQPSAHDLIISHRTPCTREAALRVWEASELLRLPAA